MAAKHILATHHSRNGLLAVQLERRGDRFERGAVYRVERPTDPRIDPDGNAAAELARQIEGWHAGATAVALGGAYYQTLTHHSTFTDPKHILQTLRFDIEEETAFDADNLAVCFESAGQSESGTDLVVYAADRGHLQSLLGQYERHGLDPLQLEPDTAAWLIYLQAYERLPEGEPVLITGWADEMLYLVALDGEHRPILSRSLLCPDPARADEMLVTELQRSLLMWGEGRQPRRLLYHVAGFTREQIMRLGQDFGLPCEALAENDPRVAFAVGAGLGLARPQVQADFRLDGMPVASQLAARRRAVFGLSAAVTLLLLSVLFVFHTYTGRYRQLAELAHDQSMRAYTDAVGEKPSTSTNMVRYVKIAYNQMREQRGERDQRSQAGSSTRTFALVLSALASLGYDFDLQIDSLRVFPDSATLAGSIPDLEAQFRLDQAVQNTPGLARESWNFEAPVAGRRPFSMNLSVREEPARVARDDR